MPKLTICLDLTEIRAALADFIRAECGVDVDPSAIEFTYSGGYDSQEVDGARVNLPTRKPEPEPHTPE